MLGDDAGQVRRDVHRYTQLVHGSKDEEIGLEAKDQYWRGAPWIKAVEFRPTPEMKDIEAWWKVMIEVNVGHASLVCTRTV